MLFNTDQKEYFYKHRLNENFADTQIRTEDKIYSNLFFNMHY